MESSPFLKSPFTDLTGAVGISHQFFGECADIEMKTLDCLEAYGLDRGLKKCDALIADYTECARKVKQYNRMFTMRKERNRQYAAGERTKENHYAPSPPNDSY
ncbi:NADH dehydrogenase [ubiquinone] iron-sulfur protein 5 [Cylas formicarius]|uniref:NADH dehydrogenase [ubiquinone] iron-sulfur protein 5 n=1 Tax=Cylas formicarius TaxID=197179 RepID=UPI0029589EEE|nr:NADH dehydrogenase [ubiquinone] iron-sulfur protein 5 [Cylas formicarius]